MSAPSKRKRSQHPDAERQQGWALGDKIVLGLGLALAGFALFQIVLFRFGRDQGIYSVVADTVLRGGMPYRDAWDFKPPGIYLVYALARAVFGSNQWGIRVLEVLGLASLFPAFSLLSRRFFGDARPGMLGAAMAIIVHAQLEFWHTGQPEFFGGVLTIWGLALAVYHDRSRLIPAWLVWLGSGVLFGAAGLMKPYLAGGAVVAAWVAVRELRHRGKPVSRQIGSVIWMVLGVALPLGACALWFIVKGAWGDLYEALFKFAPGYASLTFQPAMVLSSCYYALQVLLLGLSSLLAVGLALALLLPQRTEGEREGLAIIGVLVALHVIGIGIQSKFIPYHFSATLPLVALAAGLGAWKAWGWAKDRGVKGIALAVVVAVVSLITWTPTQGQLGSFWIRSYERTATLIRGDPYLYESMTMQLNTMPAIYYGADYQANVQVVQWLVENTEPADRVYIWGFEPFIYDLSRRKAASRYIYNVPQRVEWYKNEARAALISELRGLPPRVILVEHGDIFPMVTGNNLDSANSLADFPEFTDFVKGNYTFKISIENFDLYVQKH